MLLLHVGFSLSIFTVNVLVAPAAFAYFVVFPALSVTFIVTEFVPLLATGIWLSIFVTVVQLPVPPIAYS